MNSRFADRLGELMTLSTAEREALAGLEQRERPLRRHAVLVREGDATGELFIVRSGMLMSYVLLDDGSRQILRILLPGDMIGVGALAYARSPEGICALADAVVAPFDRGALMRIGQAHPRLSLALVALEQMERVATTDRLASMGRTAAKARVAAVLIDLRDRKHRGRDDAGFLLGLTQEEIGDITGLTAVHVNRMLRQLEEERLIARDGGRLRIVDTSALEKTANYVDRNAGIDLNWLPAPAR